MPFSSLSVRAIVFAALFTSNSALACDLCSLSNVSTPYRPSAGAIHLGIAEQFTGFDTVRDGTKKIENTAHQRIESSITQVAVGYDLRDDLSAQLVLPIINRRFARVVDGGRERGTEAGVGDLTLLARYVPYEYSSGGVSVIPHIFVGVKLPTGNSDRLEEELGEGHHDDAHSEPKHAGEDHGDDPIVDTPTVGSLVHGHDLALGTGSTDVPFGAGLFARSGRMVFEGDFQYCIRSGGSHQYQYADDILFTAAPGIYLVDEHTRTVALFAELSGENKAKDSGANGALMTDTARSALYLGPKLQAAFASGLDAELGVSWPVHYDTSAPQVAATYRIKAALGWRF